MIEVKRPGSNVWESEDVLGGAVKLSDVVGTLVRYPSGIVLRVNGLNGPDEQGNRYLNFEMYDPTEEVTCG